MEFEFDQEKGEANRYWTAIVTYRGDMIRIISVRRSRKEEVQIHGAP